MNRAQMQERRAVTLEGASDWWQALDVRWDAAFEWRAIQEVHGLRPVDFEQAEANLRALAANADRLADALSALRGRAG